MGQISAEVFCVDWMLYWIFCQNSLIFLKFGDKVLFWPAEDTGSVFLPFYPEYKNHSTFGEPTPFKTLLANWLGPYTKCMSYVLSLWFSVALLQRILARTKNSTRLPSGLRKQLKRFNLPFTFHSFLDPYTITSGKQLGWHWHIFVKHCNSCLK